MTGRIQHIDLNIDLNWQKQFAVVCIRLQEHAFTHNVYLHSTCIYQCSFSQPRCRRTSEGVAREEAEQINVAILMFVGPCIIVITEE